jgi:hypothetical protein
MYVILVTTQIQSRAACLSFRTIDCGKFVSNNSCSTEHFDVSLGTLETSMRLSEFFV